LPQPRFHRVALGGTFDHIHRGHGQLLAKAFAVAKDVVIGLTTDSLVSKEGKKGIKSYAERKQQLTEFVNEQFPGRSYTIRQLSRPLGEIGNRRDIDVVVVSEETFQRAVDANFERLQKRLKPLAVYVIPMEMAEDMRRISSTRIREGEINEDGKVMKNRIRPKFAKK
jgi:pantetheine-phosphate adenylyltransferase